MNYQYNFRPGLLIERNGFIDVINKDDLAKYYSDPQIINFNPIRLTDNILKAYGFKKSKQRYENLICYLCFDVRLVRKPFKDWFYCHNIPSSPGMKYLHELQDFLSYHYPFHIMERVRYSDFIMRYGSKQLSGWDI